MKVQFPLWLVTEPDAASMLADVRTKIRKIGDLDTVAVSRHVRGGRDLQEDAAALYTTEPEATADAQARLAARDAADNAGWIPLAELRCGAVFVTKDGARGTKIAWLADGRVDWIGADGARPFTSGDILVREV